MSLQGDMAEEASSGPAIVQEIHGIAQEYTEQNPRNYIYTRNKNKNNQTHRNNTPTISRMQDLRDFFPINITDQPRQRSRAHVMSTATEHRQIQGVAVDKSTKRIATARLPTHKMIQMMYGLPPCGKVVQTSLWGMIPMKQNTTQDNEIFGHDMETIDNVNTVRVLLQNPNGIHPHPDNKELEASLQTCHSQCISILGLSKTNVD